ARTGPAGAPPLRRSRPGRAPSAGGIHRRCRSSNTFGAGSAVAERTNRGAAITTGYTLRVYRSSFLTSSSFRGKQIPPGLHYPLTLGAQARSRIRKNAGDDGYARILANAATAMATAMAPPARQPVPLPICGAAVGRRRYILCLRARAGGRGSAAHRNPEGA